MLVLKKIAFAPLFLLTLVLFYYYAAPTIINKELLFSLEFSTLIALITMTGILVTACFFFGLFTIMAADWIFVLPIIGLAVLLPVIFLGLPLGVFIAAGSAVAFILSFIAIDNKLRTYLSFQPSVLMEPAIKGLTGYLLIVLAAGYFLSVNLDIKENGFEIPDQLIDKSLEFSPISPEIDNMQGINTSQPALPENLNITPEQLQLLRQNPAALQQFGLDPAVLDSLEQSLQKNEQNTASNNGLGIAPKDLIKHTVKTQLQTMIDPYLAYIPALLALLFYLTLKSFIAVVSLPLPFITWITFWILQKTEFIKFVTESREVKKMIV